VKEGDTTVHRIPGHKHDLGLCQDVLGQHIDWQMGLDDPWAFHGGRGLEVVTGHGLGGLLCALK